MLSITWMTGHAAGIWLITMRVFQGVGAAMLMANSSAILTDVFPDNQRGMALGVNQAAAFSGTFIGLVLGGLLAPIDWRLIFLVSVPIGLFSTVFGDLKLHETSPRRPARIDWAGNITFAIGWAALPPLDVLVVPGGRGQLPRHHAPEPPFAAGNPEQAPESILRSAKQAVSTVTAARLEAAKWAAARFHST